MYILTLIAITGVIRFLSHSDEFLGDFSVTKQIQNINFIFVRMVSNLCF